MIISTKKYLLIFSLLLSNVHTTKSFWWLYQYPTTEERVQNLKVFCKDNNVPYRDINELVRTARSVYQNNSYQNLDHDRQITKTIVVDFYTQKVALTINTVKKQEFINLSPKNRETVINNYKKELLDNLSAGRSIDHLVGDTLIASVHQLIYDAETAELSFPNTSQQSTYNNHSAHYYQQPAAATYIQNSYQPAPYQPAPAYVPSNREHYAQQNVQYIEQMLKNAANNNNSLAGSIPTSDINRLKMLIGDNTLLATSIPAENRLAHTKNSIAQLLDEKLEATKKELQPKIVNLRKLNASIEQTRKEKIAAIENWQEQEINKDSIAQLLGNNCYGKSNIEDDIITNMAIRCPVCSEEFKQEHRHGKVDKVTLKVINSNGKCEHDVCSDCMPGCGNTCPRCQSPVDQNDFNRKMRGY